MAQLKIRSQLSSRLVNKRWRTYSIGYLPLGKRHRLMPRKIKVCAAGVLSLNSTLHRKDILCPQLLIMETSKSYCLHLFKIIVVTLHDSCGSYIMEKLYCYSLNSTIQRFSDSMSIDAVALILININHLC